MTLEKQRIWNYYYCFIVAFYICSNFTITANWDYGGNDIVNSGSYTFASCCAWCLNVTACVCFTFNVVDDYCFLKNSTGTGGGSSSVCVAAAR